MTDLAGAGSRAFSRVAGLLSEGEHPPGAVRCGLIGASIKASLSPALHEREGQHLGLGTRYQLIDLDVLRLTADDVPQILTKSGSPVIKYFPID